MSSASKPSSLSGSNLTNTAQQTTFSKGLRALGRLGKNSVEHLFLNPLKDTCFHVFIFPNHYFRNMVLDFASRRLMKIQSLREELQLPDGMNPLELPKLIQDSLDKDLIQDSLDKDFDIVSKAKGRPPYQLKCMKLLQLFWKSILSVHNLSALFVEEKVRKTNVDGKEVTIPSYVSLKHSPKPKIKEKTEGEPEIEETEESDSGMAKKAKSESEFEKNVKSYQKLNENKGFFTQHFEHQVNILLWRPLGYIEKDLVGIPAKITANMVSPIALKIFKFMAKGTWFLAKGTWKVLSSPLKAIRQEDKAIKAAEKALDEAQESWDQYYRNWIPFTDPSMADGRIIGKKIQTATKLIADLHCRLTCSSHNEEYTKEVRDSYEEMQDELAEITTSLKNLTSSTEDPVTAKTMYDSYSREYPSLNSGCAQLISQVWNSNKSDEEKVKTIHKGLHNLYIARRKVLEAKKKREFPDPALIEKLIMQDKLKELTKNFMKFFRVDPLLGLHS